MHARRALLLPALLLLPAAPAQTAPFAMTVEAGQPEGALAVDAVVLLNGQAERAEVIFRLVSLASGDADASNWSGPLPGEAKTSARLRPLDGPGDYRLIVEAHAGEAAAQEERALRVQPVTTAQGEASATTTVEDSPARLILARDDVNLAKNKYPGQEVITRLRAEDDNGLGGQNVVIRVLRGPVLIEERLFPFAGNPISAAVEDRYARSPLRDGNYTLEARLGDASATRSFTILDSRTTATLAIPDAVVPDAPRALSGAIRISDRNLGSGPLDPEGAPLSGSMELKLFHGSRPATAAIGIELDGSRRTPPVTLDLSGLSTQHPSYASGNGSGAISVPLALHVPAGTPPGSYRLSLYRQGELLDSAPLRVLPIPTLEKIEAPASVGPGEELNVSLEIGTPEAIARVRIALWGAGGVVAAEEARVAPASDRITANLTLALPSPLPRGNYRLEADALTDSAARVPGSDGGFANHRNATILVRNVPPTVEARLLPERALYPFSPRSWNATFSARDANGDPVRLDAEVRDWNGSRVPWPAAFGPDGRARLDVPALAPPGRYWVTLAAEDDAGARGANQVPIDVGAILGIKVSASAAPASLAANASGTWRFRVENSGNVVLPRLDLTASFGPRALEDSAVLRWAGGNVETRLESGRASLALEPPLAAGEVAELELRITPRGVPPGDHALRLRIVAPTGDAPAG